MESCMPALRDDLVLRQVGDETLVLDRAGERIHQLNATASYVWGRCDGNTEQQAVAAELADQYQISIEQAARDVAQMLAQLEQLGLLKQIQST